MARSSANCARFKWSPLQWVTFGQQMVPWLRIYGVDFFFFLSVPDSWLHWHLAFKLYLLCVQLRDCLPGSGGDCHWRSDGGDFLHDGVEAYLARPDPGCGMIFTKADMHIWVASCCYIHFFFFNIGWVALILSSVMGLSNHQNAMSS